MCRRQPITISLFEVQPRQIIEKKKQVSEHIRPLSHIGGLYYSKWEVRP
jgi:hypothetical protein